MCKVTTKKLANKFNWKQITGNEESLHRPILLADINRPGLELAGYFDYAQQKRVVVIGNKEIHYIINKMDEVAQRRNFEFITNESTPAIVITNGHDCPPVLAEIANRKNIAVFSTEENTTNTSVKITSYLDELLAPSIVMHGELMRIHGIGVLIVGESGMGKSEIALSLIQKGHQLIADDRVDCFKIHNNLIGRVSPMLEGFMELRGVGIINVARMYGVGSYARECEVSLLIELVPFDDKIDYDRVGIEEKEYVDILGVKILKLQIPVSMGRPMATIIETAVFHYMLLRDGKDAAKEIEHLVLEEIKKNAEEADSE
ncbi:HPr(Ser) kinase/phosphatase [Floccifex sp.]|uniref:HPr(Ser) kinase/phosphatase n=1 Tax=Floccifex sp. TaxID=2815810 RepID=UPI002A75D2C0|nr:HPr(Ser) kinase/phosphatase [Floccifex sp.]MDD7280952.1 HPr(Ser) kinase/phosphatase [Erysipelotrichaceae bacterium]MDY2957827.1 HPr(Ser) kinase/phosphatase [Floccifex sp.]